MTRKFINPLSAASKRRRVYLAVLCVGMSLIAIIGYRKDRVLPGGDMSSEPATITVVPTAYEGEQLPHSLGGSQEVSEGPGELVNSHDLIREIDAYRGKLVTPLYTNACFKYNDKYHCVYWNSNRRGQIVVVSDILTNQHWKKAIDENCVNLATARSCRPSWISFRVDNYGTDVSGSTQIIYTNRINISPE